MDRARDEVSPRSAHPPLRSRERSEQQLARDRADFADDIATLAAFRHVFGPGCRLRWAHNGTRAIGQRPRGHVVCAIGTGAPQEWRKVKR